ncbi:hypothetical protein IR073_07170, partial [Gemella sp. 19428wG2_WT2a]|nr:hypothetical protein [Gemella sp. 19428wG2_WT2a]
NKQFITILTLIALFSGASLNYVGASEPATTNTAKVMENQESTSKAEDVQVTVSGKDGQARVTVNSTKDIANATLVVTVDGQNVEYKIDSMKANESKIFNVQLPKNCQDPATQTEPRELTLAPVGHKVLPKTSAEVLSGEVMSSAVVICGQNVSAKVIYDLIPKWTLTETTSTAVAAETSKTTEAPKSEETTTEA